MKIVFDRQKIINQAAPLLCAVSNKSTLRSVEGILIDADVSGECIMTTYDTEKGVRISVDAEVIEGGSYIINAQKFFSTLKVMPGDKVTLTVNDTLQAIFISGTSTHKMSALNGSDFPEIPKLKTNFGFTLSQYVMRNMITKCAHAMAVADTRPILNGCYFNISPEKVTAVSCDSFRLAECSTNADIDNNNENGQDVKFSFILPVRTVNELYKLLDDDVEKDKKMRIYMSRRQIVFNIGEITFFSSLIEGQYIDFDRIITIPKKCVIELDRAELIEALERAALITEERIAGSVRSHVKLSIEGEVLHINAESTAGSTYDRIRVEHEGEDMVIAFNNRYLLDALRASDSDVTKITFSSPRSGINIEPCDAEKADGSKSELFFLLPVMMKK